MSYGGEKRIQPAIELSADAFVECKVCPREKSLKGIPLLTAVF
jgi:hypothetical protein